MKKILLLITKGNIGGAQKMVFSLATGLQSAGHAVTVAIGAEGAFLPNELAASGIPVHIFRNLKRTYNPLTTVRFFFAFKKYVSEQKFDVIQLNSSNTIFAALAAKISKPRPKIIFTFHGLSYLDPGSRGIVKKILLWLVFKFFLLFIDVPVFVCRANAEQAKKMHLTKKGVVIYNGVNTTFLSRTDARQVLEQKLSISLVDKVLVGSIGRLAYPKNYELLIEAAAMLSPLEGGRGMLSPPFQGGVGVVADGVAPAVSPPCFLLIGDGPERAKYEHLIRTHNVSSKFFLLGELPNASTLLPAFDIFVLPSLYEGLSLTLLEALQAGVLVLASRVGGNPEILEKTPEQLFSPRNKADFQNKLNYLIGNFEARQKLGETNKILGDKFSTAQMVASYQQLL